ncbi:efflux RND transporter periplasmic adaptor subunit [Gluconacetobacter tumulisoli]|uniref:Efflux RND transporter periplasmic adaptor subunit n=1 Tax=Gluconacetobacter tumulisoli TaxID=1286189 RepID=A0A7W4PKN1_9PROT|nr:efflux RND transporter periplasmic adaptor subunit [Gluconacetobacter tumulisoli]MBB2201562.1 efflux RND transporter periplasmic adaptor subunit [Gluconacetobacter tumulisoli]
MKTRVSRGRGCLSVLPLVACAVLLSGLGVFQAVAADRVVTISPDALKKMEIGTAQAVTGSLRGHVTCPAYVVPDDRAVARIHAVGQGRILQVRTYPGQIVSAGQVLMEYDDYTLTDVQQQVRAAEATLEEAQATRDGAALAARRADALRGGALAAGEVERRRMVLRHAEGAVREQQALLDNVRMRLAQFSSRTERPDGHRSLIVSPVAGVVRAVNVAAGDSTASGPLPLVEIDDLSSVWVVSQVMDRDATQLAPGNPQLTFPGSDPAGRIESRINTIDGSVDVQTRLLLVRSLVDNHARRLRPGMLVTTALFRSVPVSGIIVPDSAIQTIDGRFVVFVRIAPERYAARDVQVGPTADGRAVVTQGLSAGDTVVTHGSFTLKSQLMLARPGGGP